MPKSIMFERARTAALAIAVLALLAACGSSHRASRQPSSDPVADAWPCLEGTGAQLAKAGGAHPVPFVTFGAGARAVLVSNQSDENLCPWSAFAKTLAGHGYRVVLYDYAFGPELDLATIADYLRPRGVTALALLGASEGGKGSIMAATELRPAPQAVVTLSAEEHYGNQLVAPFAAKLTSAVLYVSAEHDEYSAAPAARAFMKVTPAAVKQLDIVPGSAHGTALLAQPAVVTTVTGFLDAHDR